MSGLMHRQLLPRGTGRQLAPHTYIYTEVLIATTMLADDNTTTKKQFMLFEIFSDCHCSWHFGSYPIVNGLDQE
jgi:hypothetical protein